MSTNKYNGQPKRESEIVLGTVVSVTHPFYSDQAYKGEGGYSPAKIIIDTDRGQESLTIFADYETREMSALWTNLDADSLVGRSVQAIATSLSDYDGMKQWKLVKITVGNNTDAEAGQSGSGSPEAPAPLKLANKPTSVSVAPQSPIEIADYSPVSRYEVGQSIGNARNIAGAVISAYVSKHGSLPEPEFLDRTAQMVLYFTDSMLTKVHLFPETEEEIKPKASKKPSSSGNGKQKAVTSTPDEDLGVQADPVDEEL